MTDTATIPSPDHEALRVRVPSESGASAAGLAEQLDIPLLDDYLQTLLLPQVDSMLQYFPWKQQLPAALKLALLQLVTLWMSQGQTPATRALNLELVPSPSNSNSNSNASPRPSKRQPMGSWVNQHRLVVYSILSIGLPRLYQYAQEKWRQQQQQRQQHPGSIPEDDDETSIRRRARERRVQTVDTMFRVIDTAVPMMRLSLLLACWSWYSKSRTNTNTNTTLQALTPNLAMWLVGWQHQYQYQYQYQYQSTLTSANQNNNSNGGNGGGTSRQPLHVQHAHRRWLQEESMRLVPMVITPLWNTCQESRAYVQAWCRSTLQPLRRQMVRMKKRYQASLPSPSTPSPKSRCPVCSQDPIGIPYETNCGHAYCYSCLWQEQQAQTSCYCRVCHELISSCRPCD